MAEQAKPERRVFYNNEDCAVRNVVSQIGDKWSLLILFALVDGEDRFNALKSRIEGISQRMLTQTLRDLEREGYVNRTVYPEVPVKVEYGLTEMGRELVKPLYQLVCWADDHRQDIERARKAYDEKNA
ncbi:MULTISPECIES: winged helix-turn-helix transcriptional regulator [Vibrio]|uniref:winged helix-turn-helix transcriptional regulator n=1 Tax=Vibrio TaxID=662 RepID=UPI0005FA2734|nr:MULTISPECIES: helix-turn-helix domain-containing protein [Vibrio]KJY82695.1 HxlR family transcriptional regulator [Vibrio neptunius]MDA0117334.1 helix-turn-helix domain-containing protein [Vibrio sp. T11.5]QXX09302.1 helix-turn-helix transcriptional regulator [Vibrio neptunius]